MSDVRPVWLTENEAEDAGYLDRWDAAPADATEAVEDAIKIGLKDWVHLLIEEREAAARSVLHALGMPGA